MTSTGAALRSPTKSELKGLAEGIILAQGNVFIKDLLRRKGLRIGATKAAFVQNLQAAIDSEDITAEDVETWLQEVEGWGTEHVYLFRLPADVATQDLWSSSAKIRAALRRAGFEHLWEAPSSLAFPDRPTLTGIYHGLQGLRFVWHEGFDTLVREPGLDFEQIIDDDRYEFRAYLHRRRRAVMRFDFRPSDRAAAAFLQVPVTATEHDTALSQVWETVSRLIPREKLEPLDVGQAIRALDERQLRPEMAEELKTHQARLSGQGGYVEFGATSGDQGYRDVDVIREVRLALQPGSVTGDRATIIFTTPDGMGPSRTVNVQLYGRDRRLWLRSQMTEAQVWHLLRRILELS